MTGNFDTAIIHGGDGIEKTVTQPEVSDAKEPSPALEHVESLSVPAAGGKSTASWYFPPSLFISDVHLGI
jgi:hypothetical protein